MERSKLIELLPMSSPLPGQDGGPEEGREKTADRVIEFVDQWFRARAGSGEEIDAAIVAWREAFGRDDLEAAALASFNVVDDNRQALTAWAIEVMPRIFATQGAPIVVRFHPEGKNRYWPNVANVSFYKAQLADKLEIRCNLRQPRDRVTITDRDVRGDTTC